MRPIIRTNPGQKSWYKSDFLSDYYTWFVEMGYPNLDLNVFKDGEWAILEMYNSPVIPSLTKFRYVFSGIRNVLITPGVIGEFIERIDNQKKRFWDIEEKKTADMEAEKDAQEIHREDMVARAHLAITGNEGLMNRIAKNGLGEMNLKNIFNNISRQQL